MRFLETVRRARSHLEEQGRVSPGALKREFELDDDTLEALVEELVDVQRVAAREGGILSWVEAAACETSAAEPQTQAVAAVGADSPAGSPEPLEGERRQLTVMFCDLVGSTQLAETLDPEDLRAVVHAYQESSTEKIVKRFDGHVAQYLGDGLLVYFGYPRAHEDDPVRGVRAALAILDDLPELNAGIRERFPALGEASLRLRIGVHTGPVVVGEMGAGERRERLALGETVNVASRLLSACEPGQVVISEATRSLVRGIFVFEPLGPRSLDGIAEPVSVSRVIRRSGVRTRLDVAAATGLTPLVGREQEVALLLDRWELATEGHGQVVLLGGEAGMGKSRLVQTVRQRLAEEPHSWVELCCSAYHESSALYPVIDLLEQALLLSPEDSAEEKLAKLESSVRHAGFPVPEVLPLFATLLSVPLPGPDRALPLGPDAQRQRTLDWLAAWILATSRAQPVILVVEDLHWIDPSSLELLGTLVDQCPTAPLLLLATFRPGFQPPWPSRSHTVQLTLNPLSRRQVRGMVEGITGGKALPPQVLDEVVAKTDGVPLFVEELTKMVLESGLLEAREARYELSGPLPPLAIPATLQDSLMARLDRLGPTKEVVQLGAVLGREFPHEMLEAVSSLDAPTLEQALDRLVAAELLYQRGARPRASYTFKHALIQDTAYQSLLKSTRQQYHARVAKVLEERFPERVESAPELLAHHYEVAGLLPQAVSRYQHAGERAVQRSALAEATRHIHRGLALLESLPDGAARRRLELRLQISLGMAGQAVLGFGSAEVERAFARARELCRGPGDAAELAFALIGLYAVYQGRAQYLRARPVGQELLELGRSMGDPAIQLSAHSLLAVGWYALGEFGEALAAAKQAIALEQPERPVYGGLGERGVLARAYAAWTLFCLGHPDQAGEMSQQALRRAEELGHPLSRAWAVLSSTLTCVYRRDWPQAQARAEAVIDLARELGFAYFSAIGTQLRGAALAGQGRLEEGIAGMREGRAALEAMQSNPTRSHPLYLEAEAYLARGALEEARETLAEALEDIEKTQGREAEAEVHRVKGELLLSGSPPDPSGAEACFRRALDVARAQSAKSWELRAAISLARLWQRQNREDEARALLAPVYEWFTEGFDTADLKDAKALLQQIS